MADDKSKKNNIPDKQLEDSDKTSTRKTPPVLNEGQQTDTTPVKRRHKVRKSVQKKDVSDVSLMKTPLPGSSASQEFSKGKGEKKLAEKSEGNEEIVLTDKDAEEFLRESESFSSKQKINLVLPDQPKQQLSPDNEKIRDMDVSGQPKIARENATPIDTANSIPKRKKELGEDTAVIDISRKRKIVSKDKGDEQSSVSEKGVVEVKKTPPKAEVIQMKEEEAESKVVSKESDKLRQESAPKQPPHSGVIISDQKRKEDKSEQKEEKSETKAPELSGGKKIGKKKAVSDITSDKKRKETVTKRDEEPPAVRKSKKEITKPKKSHKGLFLFLFLLIILLCVCGAGFGIYKFKPVLFNRLLRKTNIKQLAFLEIPPEKFYKKGLNLLKEDITRNEAINYFKESALKSYAPGEFELGRCYRDGIGCAKDMGEAVKWFKLAAEHKNIKAAFELAVLLSSTRKEKDIVKASLWFLKVLQHGDKQFLDKILKLAEAGNISAYRALYNFYSKDKKDNDKAVFYLAKAADTGDRHSMFLFSSLFKNGKGNKKNIHKSIEYLKKLLLSPGFSSKALATLETFAANGNIEAQRFLYKVYKEGLGGIAKDENKALAYLKQAAENEDRNSILLFASQFKNGQGNKEYIRASLHYLYTLLKKSKDNSKALDLLKQFADNGVPEARRLVWKVYMNGVGVQRDVSEAIKYLEEAAKDNDPEALILLGKLYKNGMKVRKDFKKALAYALPALKYDSSEEQARKLISQLANSNYIPAMKALYEFYISPNNRDNKMALQWLKKAADAGDVGSQFLLGKTLFFGDLGVKNPEKAEKYLYKAEEAGNKRAEKLWKRCVLKLAKDKLKRKQYGDAVELLKKASVKNVGEALNLLGKCYLDGNGVVRDLLPAEKFFARALAVGYIPAKPNLSLARLELGKFYLNAGKFKSAVNWLTKSAESGNIEAKYLLGQCYLLGQGVKTNFFQAEKYFSEVVALKTARKYGVREKKVIRKAELLLGKCRFKIALDYYNGKMFREALPWLIKCAENNNPRAQYLLGQCYYEGKGTHKNLIQAEKWLAKAVINGYKKAEPLLKECRFEEGKISDERLAWIKKNAPLGNPDAQLLLGKCYLKGVGFKKDLIQADKWLAKALANNNSEAKRWLSLCRELLAKQYEIEHKFSEALKWYIAASELNNANAEFKAGLYYFEGKGVNKNLFKAERLFTKAFSDGNRKVKSYLADVLFLLAKNAYKNRNYKYAYETFKRAFEYGKKKAGYFLGLALLYGKGVKKNQNKGFEYLKNAADSGDSNAAYYVALCYEKGQGIKVNLKKALAYMSQAVSSDKKDVKKLLSEIKIKYAKSLLKNKPHQAIKLFEEASDAGNPEAEYMIGMCCYKGIGIKKDLLKAEKRMKNAYEKGFEKAQKDLSKVQYEIGKIRYDERYYSKAVDWFVKSYSNGNYQAAYSLGTCYYNGQGVPKDVNRAIELFMIGSGENNPDCQYALGTCYLKKQVKFSLVQHIINWLLGLKSENYAVEWFKMAAASGHLKAQNQLALCYLRGIGVTKNIKKAIRLLKKSVKKGSAEAEYNLGICYKKGCGVPKNSEKAVVLFGNSAEKDYAPAQLELGKCYMNGLGVEINPKEGIKWYEKAAENGNTEAQVLIAEAYLTGKGVAKNPAKAIKMLTAAAEKGNALAQTELANCYFYGRGVKKNLTKVVEWNKKSAKNGNALGIYRLGICYANGYGGLKEDDNQAFFYFYSAALKGNTDAQYLVGLYYLNGYGDLVVDRPMGIYWLKLAAKNGNTKAAEFIKKYLILIPEKVKP